MGHERFTELAREHCLELPIEPNVREPHDLDGERRPRIERPSL
jgi:hypothetical protein